MGGDASGVDDPRHLVQRGDAVTDLTRAHAIALEIARAYNNDRQGDVLVACAVVLQAVVAQMQEPDATQCCAAACNIISAPLVARLGAARPAGMG